MKTKIAALLVLIIFVLVLVNIASVSATSVDKLSICNIKGHAGDMIEVPITLKSTSDSERIGHWSTFYKKVEGEGDGEDEKAKVKKMDITSWITITPANYTLKPGETKVFTVRISIPSNAKTGLYGATSEDADMEGHSNERRTYIVFEDMDASAAEAGGHGLASGLIIPISVNVLVKPGVLTSIIKVIEANIITIMFVAIIMLLLLVVMLRRKRGKGQG